MLETSSNPESLLLVSSTLEIAALMKRLHPACENSLCEIEAEVRQGGQLLLDAGSTSRARIALETIHRARLKLQQFGQGETRFTA